MNANVEAILATGLGPLFVAVPKGEHTRVRTPFCYPDGGVVDVFVRERDDGTFTISDLGECLGWVRTQSVGSKRSPQEQKLLEDVCLTEGVELLKGELELRISDPAKFAGAVVQLAQAVVRVAEVSFNAAHANRGQTND